MVIIESRFQSFIYESRRIRYLFLPLNKNEFSRFLVVVFERRGLFVINIQSVKNDLGFIVITKDKALAAFIARSFGSRLFVNDVV